jgi:hypothetical protein
MNNKINKISFEDTDKKLEIDIYGKVFEINVNKLDEIKTEELENEEDINAMDKMLDSVLGDGAVEEINKIRKDAGYDKMAISHELAIFMKMIELYANSVMAPIDNLENTYNNMYNKMNRFERRNYNKGYRNNYNNRYRR